MGELKPGRTRGNQEAGERGSRREFTRKTTQQMGGREAQGGKPPAQGSSIPCLDDRSPCSHLQSPVAPPSPHAASVYSQLSATGTLWAPKSNHTPSLFIVLSWLPSSPEYKFPQVPTGLLCSGKQYQSGVTQRP